MADSILALAANPPHDHEERKALYSAAKKLMFATESNHDVQHRIFYGGFPLYICKIASDLGVFKALANTVSRAWTPAKLAEHLDCEELLLSRVLRGLVAYGLVAYSHTDATYSSNATTVLFATAGVGKAGIMHQYLTVMPSMHHLPELLQQRGMKCPTSAFDTAFQRAMPTKDDVFTYYNSHPEDQKAGMDLWAAQRADQPSWIPNEAVFPSEIFKLSKDELSKGRALMVDVGGGSGHQSVAVRTLRQEYPGPMILQDLPVTIDRVNQEELSKLDIQCMPHDFRTPQPVRHAKIYYLRNILHDWPDDIALDILRQLRPAMANDSFLIIDDIVVAGGGEARWQQVNYDFVMMSVIGALERTEDQWKELLAATGFALREIHEYDTGKGDSLVIAVPV